MCSKVRGFEEAKEAVIGKPEGRAVDHPLFRPPTGKQLFRGTVFGTL